MTTQTRLTFGVFVLVLALGGAGFELARRAVQHGLSSAGIGPLVGPGYVDSFHVTCGTSATLIQSPYGQVSYEAEVDSGAGGSVYFGDSDVTTSTYGASAAAGAKVSANARHEYCVSAGSETVHIRALVASDPG